MLLYRLGEVLNKIRIFILNREVMIMSNEGKKFSDEEGDKRIKNMMMILSTGPTSNDDI